MLLKWRNSRVNVKMENLLFAKKKKTRKTKAQNSHQRHFNTFAVHDTRYGWKNNVELK